jgi:sialate O-acetylesterase
MTASEQQLFPVLDGFLRQQQKDFVSNLSYGELKKISNFARQIYLDFDFGSVAVGMKTAKLRVYCQSFDKYGEPTVSAYCLPGYQTAGLTWDARPSLPEETAAVEINRMEHTNTWLEWDLSAFLPVILAKADKTASIVLAITLGNDALVKLAMSENGAYAPYILLTDEEPATGNHSIIKMPTVFSDNMVIQRDKPIKVWGEALPNEAVAVRFNDIDYQTQCGGDGKFSFTLPSLGASEAEYTMTVTAGGESFACNNIVMGDVFIFGGQSNMAFSIGSAAPEQLAEAVANANYPNLRFFEVAKIVSGGVLTGEKDKKWKSSIPERIPTWSAIAFFLGRDLHKHAEVPVGLINVSHGGATCDAFISPEAYLSDPELNAAKCPDGTGIYQYYTTPSSLYNQMIYKVAGYPAKGFVWYQGESNAKYWNKFKTVFQGLIKDWRTQWGDANLPFLFVQLPAYERTDEPNGFSWAEIRDAQLQTWQETANTGMVVTVDAGDPGNIHPTDKYTVAKRLLPYARALVYNEQVNHKSPIYKSHEVIGNELFVTFDNITENLVAVKEITEFEICGADGVYRTAAAVILPDNRIKLNNAAISAPEHVRYAWKNNTTISLFTSDSRLPLSPFRSARTTVAESNLVEIPFDDIQDAYASSTYSGRLPLYAVNGAGLLNNTTHEASMMSKAWHSELVNFPVRFLIELKTPKDITTLRIWNLNWTSAYLNRGAKDIEIYTSTSGEALENEAFTSPVWEKVHSCSLQQATGDASCLGELHKIAAVAYGVKWAGINILNNHAGNSSGYTGLSEVKLYSSAFGGAGEQIRREYAEWSDISVRGKTIVVESRTDTPLVFALYSSQGACLKAQKINPQESVEMNVPQNGFYIVRLMAGDKKRNIKVMI